MKTLLSIGTGPGIGLATAERFAKEGFRIIASARSADKTKALTEQLKANGYQAEVHTVDAGNLANVAALIATVQQQYGSIEVLHYNAASMRQATLQTQPQETLVSDLAVNIGGALAATQAVLPDMLQKKAGTILITGGGFALYPSPDFVSLSIGKAGLRNLTLGLFESLRSQDVHIASVTVATSVTPGSKEALDIAEKFWQLYTQPKELWVAEVAYPSA